MRCPVCGVEMVIWKVTEEGPVYVCRNQRCPQFDSRLKKAEEQKES